KNRTALPYLIIPTRFPQVPSVDIISILQNPYLFGTDSSQNTASETGPRKWVPAQNTRCYPKCFAHPAHLIFKEGVERLHHFQLHEVGQPTHIVMRLDRGRRAIHRNRLDDIGIDGALPE